MDEVYQRIIDTQYHNTFLYHSGNVCYKPYTLSKCKSAQIPDQEFESEINADENEFDTNTELRKRLRASLDSTREKPSSEKQIKFIKRLICNQLSKKVYEKYRLEKDDRGKKLRDIALRKLNDVFERISDIIHDEKRLFSTDLYCHKDCIRSYLRETDISQEMIDESMEKSQRNYTNRKRDVLEKVVGSIDIALLGGTGFTLSDIRDVVNEEIHPLEIYNFQIKEYLIKHYGDRIKFSPSTTKNESLLFFSSIDQRESEVGVNIGGN